MPPAPELHIINGATPLPAWLIGVLAGTLTLLILWLGWWWLSPNAAQQGPQMGAPVAGVIGHTASDSLSLSPGEELLKPPTPSTPLPIAAKAPVVAHSPPRQHHHITAEAPAPAWVNGTQPVCLSCGWVESVAVLPTAANVPPGVVTAVAAAQGAQAAQAMQATRAGRGMASDPITAATAGAMAGAFLGSSLERRAPGPSSVYEVRIRMEDGSLRTYEQADAPPLGAKVIFEGGQPHWLLPAPPKVPLGSKIYTSY